MKHKSIKRNQVVTLRMAPGEFRVMAAGLRTGRVKVCHIINGGRYGKCMGQVYLVPPKRIIKVTGRWDGYGIE